MAAANASLGDLRTWTHHVLPTMGVCRRVLTVLSQNNRAERSSVNPSVVFKRNIATALVLGMGRSSGSLWKLEPAVYCGDCKIFCPMSRIPPVSAKLALQWQISGQHFPSLKISIKMFHSQYYLVATLIQIQFLRSQICMCVYLYIHIFFTI